VRIALLIPSFLPVRGGAEIGALELARALATRGHEVSVLTPRLRPTWPLREDLDDVEVRRYDVPAPRGRDRTLNLVVGTWWHAGALLRVLAPDLVNLHYVLPTGLGGQWWCSRLGIPTVMTLIGMDVYDPHYRPAAPWRALMRRAVRRADAVTCISSFVHQVVERDYPPAIGVPCQVIPYGVDVKRFRPGLAAGSVRARFGFAPDDRVVLCVQRLYPRKRVQEFVDAAAVVAAEEPTARFLVVGDGPDRSALEGRAARLALGGRLCFAGEVANEDLPAYYAAADVFALHTLHEGLGIVLLEALASGCAVVTTRAGGTTDIVRDGDTGVLVPPGDHAAFAGAIIALLRDPVRRRTLAVRGRHVAETEFAWDAVAARYLEVFTRATGRR
jgi:phosphatidylinositol alpha-1,6-mannosyltransferase